MPAAGAWFESLLQAVAEAVGDPAPRVYERLFARRPELLPLFAGDASGAVRGEMFHRAVDTLADLSEGQPYALGMVAAERANHAMNGVPVARFDEFFDVMGEVFREAAGSAWTAQTEVAWQGLLGQLSGSAGAAAAPD